MKKILQKTSTVFILCFTGIVFAQTPGTLTVVYTPTVPSSATFYSGTRHLGAAWIQSSSGTFTKTKIKYCGGNCDHLSSSTWQTASGGSTTGADVASGATKTTFTAISFTWNGTNTSNVIVADGAYNIKIFEVWNHGSSTNQQQTSTIAFTKGTTASTITPANTSWLKNIKVIWHPGVSVPSNTVGTLSNPLTLACNSSTTGTTTDGISSINNYASCGPQGEFGKEKVYMFTLSQLSDVHIALTNMTVDLDIQLLSAPNAASCISRNDNTINATNLSAGTYYAVVDGFGSSLSTAAEGTFNISLTCTPVTTTGFEIQQIDQKVSVFPNPATNLLHINILDENTDDYQITLTDEIGRVVYVSLTAKTSDIDVSAFDKGIYFINFYNTNTKKTFYKKIIIANGN